MKLHRRSNDEPSEFRGLRFGNHDFKPQSIKQVTIL